MKDKKIGVSKVVIQMGDKEATLTVEQAKELRDALNSLLGEKVVEKVIHDYRYYPYVHYEYPRKIYASPSWEVYGTITTGNTSSYTINMTDGNSDLVSIS